MRNVHRFQALLTVALGAILYLALTPAPPEISLSLSDKFNHLLAFYTLAVLCDQACIGTRFLPVPALWLLAYGLLIECLQYFLPWRDASLLDLLTDAVGLGLYALSAPLWYRLPGFTGTTVWPRGVRPCP